MFSYIVLHHAVKSISGLAYHHIAESNIVAVILFIGHATPNSHQQTKSNRGEVFQELNRYRRSSIITNFGQNCNHDIMSSYFSQ